MRTFTFTVFADESDSANNELLACLQQATEVLRSGARQKFTAIGKQDLIDWVCRVSPRLKLNITTCNIDLNRYYILIQARENKGLNQACIDAHQHWASGAGSELPESILAKLLHFRLHQARLDYLEAQKLKTVIS